ncbi:MAG: hypothetical protein AB7O24_05875 [Kofleriaceae bacterium]
MPPEIVLDGASRVLVVLHAAAAIVLIGASTHHVLIAIGYLRGSYKIRLARIYAATLAIAYAITMAFGLLAYPSFRYHVRGLYLDHHDRWASNLFDMKENFAALGIPAVIALVVMSRVLEPKTDRMLIRGYAGFAILVAAIVWFDVFAGLAVTLAKGVG